MFPELNSIIKTAKIHEEWRSKSETIYKNALICRRYTQCDIGHDMQQFIHNHIQFIHNGTIGLAASNTAGSQWLLRELTASYFQSKMEYRGRKEVEKRKAGETEPGRKKHQLRCWRCRKWNWHVGCGAILFFEDLTFCAKTMNLQLHLQH